MKKKERLELEAKLGNDNVNGYNIDIYHKSVIDEYFDNGFNAAKAVRTVNPSVTDGSSKVFGHIVLKAPENQAYIRVKQRELQLSNGINANQLVDELKTIAYSDATDYLGLTVEELKELPPDVRRCIGQIQVKEKTYKDRQGKNVTEKHVIIKLLDKIAAFEMLAKHLNLYDSHNQSKATSIDLSKLSKEELTQLYEVKKMLSKGSE